MCQFKELFEKHDRVWFSLPDEESWAQFLKAVTAYDPDSTAERSQIGYHMAYGTDRQLRYVSWLVWTQTFGQADKPVRVDPASNCKGTNADRRTEICVNELQSVSFPIFHIYSFDEKNVAMVFCL